MSTNDDRLMLTPMEAAQRLGIGRTRMYELIATGQIPTILVGKRRRVPVAALMDWLAQGTVRAVSNEGSRT